MTLIEKRARSDKGRAYYAANREARQAYQRAYDASKRSAGGLTGKVVREMRIKAQTPELARHPLCRLIENVLWDQVALYEDVTGIPHDLDHTIPLCCGGPHAPWNLQPLAMDENLTKRKALA